MSTSNALAPDETMFPGVINIGLDRLDETAELLATVFAHYPLDDYLFEENVSESFANIRSSFRMDCLWKLGLGWPLVGVQVDGKLAAVMAIQGSSTSSGGAICFEDSPLTFSRLEKMEEKLNKTFGGLACERILQYYKLREEGKPQNPVLYIEALATLAEYRGRGFGGMLLRFADRLSDADPLSTGTALDTQDPVNVKVYSHLGYQVTGEYDLGPVHTWFMFKPKMRHEI